MKSERVTLLTTKEFKRFLGSEAKREGVSVAELVRKRCVPKADQEELLFAGLTSSLREALHEAESSLKAGLREAESVLSELKSRRDPGGSPDTGPRSRQ